MLTPGTGGFGYMRLGMDEVRVFVVTLVIAILYAVATAIAFAAAFIIGGIAIGVMEGWGALVMVLAVLAAIAHWRGRHAGCCGQGDLRTRQRQRTLRAKCF